MLRFPPLKALNDPFEGKPPYQDLESNAFFITLFEKSIDDVVEINLQSMPNDIDSLSSDDKEKLSNLLRSKIYSSVLSVDKKYFRYRIDSAIYSLFEKTGVGILSLSQVKDNILMWSHYCQDHKGFVVGFDISHKFFDRRSGNNNIINNLRQVNYYERRHFQHITGYSDIDNFFNSLLFTKSINWEYEEEWRMVVPGIFGMTQYGIPGLDAVQVEAVKEIYIGVKAEQELKDCAIYFCHKYDITNIYQMELHDTDYALQPVQINLDTGSSTTNIKNQTT